MVLQFDIVNRTVNTVNANRDVTLTSFAILHSK